MTISWGCLLGKPDDMLGWVGCNLAMDRRPFQGGKSNTPSYFLLWKPGLAQPVEATWPQALTTYLPFPHNALILWWKLLLTVQGIFKAQTQPTGFAHLCVQNSFHLKSFVLRCAEFFQIDNLCYSKIFSSYYWWGVNSYNDYRCSSCFIPQFFRSFLCLPVLLYRFSISVCLVNAIENNKLQTSYLKCKVCLLCPS